MEEQILKILKPHVPADVLAGPVTRFVNDQHVIFEFPNYRAEFWKFKKQMRLSAVYEYQKSNILTSSRNTCETRPFTESVNFVNAGGKRAQFDNLRYIILDTTRMILCNFMHGGGVSVSCAIRRDNTVYYWMQYEYIDPPGVAVRRCQDNIEIYVQSETTRRKTYEDVTVPPLICLWNSLMTSAWHEYPFWEDMKHLESYITIEQMESFVDRVTRLEYESVDLYKHGHYADAIKKINEIIAIPYSNDIHPNAFLRYNLVCCYSRMGDRERAVTELISMDRDGWDHWDHIRFDPNLIHVSTDPRVREILKRHPANFD